MTSPAFNEPFNPLYDEYSISRKDFELPPHFDFYAPEFVNEVDFHCLSVISPNPEHGAKIWTDRGSWITIGIYRDEGREPAQRPPTVGLTWSRAGSVLTMTDPDGHRLRNGDTVDLYNINVASLLKRPITVLNDTQFVISTFVFGDTTGSIGAYQPTAVYNFFEENYVFRMLPSFKLVKWADIQSLFELSAPDVHPQTRELFNITSNSVTKLPRGKSATSNYDLPNSRPTIDNVPLAKRFGQIYNEVGDPLKIEYQETGQPVPVTRFDEPNLDNRKSLNVPTTQDTRVYVYDFYGFEINDPARGPFHRTDLITRDTSKQAPFNNILRASQNQEPLYGGKLYDRFGNLVIGIQENDATSVRLNLLPLKLDRFNKPIKSPINRLGRLQGF